MELLACNRSNQAFLDPCSRPYSLRFFEHGKVEPYVIGYSILLVSVLFKYEMFSKLFQASPHWLAPHLWELQERCRPVLEDSVREGL
jgi:hypothetical protein